MLTAMPVGIMASGASYPLTAVTVLCLASGALMAWTSELLISARWTQALRDAIYAHYKWAQTLDWTLVYVPNKSSP